MSTTGVPYTMSTSLTFNMFPFLSKSSTTVKPMGLGLLGRLVAKTPRKPLRQRGFT